MKKPNKRICLISGVSFFAGAWVGCFALIALFSLFQWNSGQRQKEIKLFFNRTVHSIFEGTYDPNEGSVYSEAIETIKEYEPRLGKKCKLFITDGSPNYNECIAFFPTGDFFYVLIDRKGKSWVINKFYLLNWGKIEVIRYIASVKGRKSKYYLQEYPVLISETFRNHSSKLLQTFHRTSIIQHEIGPLLDYFLEVYYGSS